MRELNQYAISRALGSKVAPIEYPRFGNFSLLATLGSALKQRTGCGKTMTLHRFSIGDDRLIVQSFEDVRNGAAPDCILWDKRLATLFERRCRELGLSAPTAMLNRRLLNVRKNSPRYAKLGIRISPATKNIRRPSIVPKFAHAIEFALVRLRYRYGASIDDVLLDPELGSKFEELALAMAPNLAITDLRLGALYIRKTRHFSTSEYPLLESLDPAEIDDEWSDPLHPGSKSHAVVPAAPGLIEVKENDRSLYITRTDDIAPAVTQLCTGKPFKLMANHFWNPDLGAIGVRFIAGKKIHDVSARRWELRLIQSNEPAFNWPVADAA